VLARGDHCGRRRGALHAAFCTQRLSSSESVWYWRPNFVAQQPDCSYSEPLDSIYHLAGRQYPTLSRDESRCVQNAACAVLVANGVCARAQNARPTKTGSAAGSSSSASTEVVCR